MGQSRVGFGILVALAMLLADGVALEAQGRGRNKAFRIPPGHMPPPGECRVWYPGVPPGHQPPSVACRALRGRHFPGAVIVRTPARQRYVRDFDGFDRVERFFRVDARYHDDRYRDDRYRDSRQRDVGFRDSSLYLSVWEPGPNGWVELRLAF